MNEVEELCNRVAIIRAGRMVYEGRLDELRASAAGSYTLRTSDDESAAQICALQPGIRDLVVLPDGLRMRADEAAIESLSIELARSQVALRALIPDAASLEERFFALTEDPVEAPAAAPAPALERVA
jgi:ABC-2 type transport system ATP-binding protein